MQQSNNVINHVHIMQSLAKLFRASESLTVSWWACRWH